MRNWGCDVAVVGAGVTGCAIAYLLARRGIDVVLVERDHPGAHASGSALGLLNPLYGAQIPGPLQPLALEGYRLHHQLWLELQVQTGINVQGYLVPLLLLPEGEQDISRLSGLEEGIRGIEGFGCRWLSPGEVQDLDQRIDPGALPALLIEGVAMVDSYLYTLALCRAAQRYGATLVAGTVKGLELSGDQVVGLQLSQGSLACQQVVLATGPWCQQAGQWLGLPVPVYPQKGEILQLALPGPTLAPVVYQGSYYLASKPGGLVWAGTTEEDAGFDHRPSHHARSQVMERISCIMPMASRAKVVGHTACLRPNTPDNLPIVGPVPGRQGVYLATGAGHKGILLSPAIAQAVTDMVIAGSTLLPVAGLGPGRFAGGASG